MIYVNIITFVFKMSEKKIGDRHYPPPDHMYFRNYPLLFVFVLKILFWGVHSICIECGILRYLFNIFYF